jgi:hypothetical protein
MTNGAINAVKSTSIRPTLSVLAEVGRNQALNSKSLAAADSRPA